MNAFAEIFQVDHHTAVKLAMRRQLDAQEPNVMLQRMDFVIDACFFCSCTV